MVKDSTTASKIMEFLSDKLSSDKGLCNFINLLFTKCYSFKNFSDYAVLLEIAKDVYYDKLPKHVVGTSVIEVKNFKGSGDDCNYVVFEIINDDMPILINQTISVLRSAKLTMLYFNNVVLSVKQHNDGLSVRRYDNNITEQTSQPEEEWTDKSVVFFIIKCDNSSFINECKNRLLASFDNTRASISNYPEILSVIKGIIEYVEANLENGNHKEELLEFCKWITDRDNFTISGCLVYTFVKESDQKFIQDTKAIKKYGICNIESFLASTQTGNLIQKDQNAVEISRLDERLILCNLNGCDSNPGRLYSIDIKIIKNPENVEVTRILGHFSPALLQSNIPVVKHRINNVLERCCFKRFGYKHTILHSILNSFSMDELLECSVSDMLEASLKVLSYSLELKTHVFRFFNDRSNWLRYAVLIPTHYFDSKLNTKIILLLSNDIQYEFMESEYLGIETINYTKISISFYSSKGFTELHQDAKSIQDLEGKISSMAKPWFSGLCDLLYANNDAAVADTLRDRYLHAFSEGYKEAFSPIHAFHDIKKLQEADKSTSVILDLYFVKHVKDYQLKIYVDSSNPLTLQEILAVIDNLGIQMDRHNGYEVHLGKKVIKLHHFVLKSSEKLLSVDSIKKNFEYSLGKVFSKDMENDYLNSLIVAAGLNWNQVILIRSICAYLQQMGIANSQSYIHKLLFKYSDIIISFVKLFECTFDPDFVGDRSSERSKFISEIKTKLDAVSSIVHDTLLRTVFSVFQSILRTNYYLFKPYLSLKIRSSGILQAPLPKPFAEIYVYSSQFEAVHLRGGKIARGGLRWSDRTEDFRFEVLGLMKAQMTKNSVIVPVGSKGGFVVKDCIDLEIVEQCYVNFLSGMLDITDNIIKGEVITPKKVIRLDDQDPYLVVAADKGTATMSDRANSVAQKYNFWLNDAFASGGSYGYDHKKMAITSRGAWIALKQHLWELERDPTCSSEALKVIGIGDMSGDLFGNGMLLSKNILLLAAFNHMHIFVDPSPDPGISYNERLRLFNKAGSTWEDYDSNLLSAGGMIYRRQDKSLNLTPEICSMLNISNTTVQPNMLIKSILLAKVDFVWNGGIGTYVKSSSETHHEVADKFNDHVRVNGRDLQCQIFVEGGNLGCTQKGRIEYSSSGGHINADFIDNSGGVICSDLEVNIKIIFEKMISEGVMTYDLRNSMLTKMEDEVAEMVLDLHNRLETKSLSLDFLQAEQKFEQHYRLVVHLKELNLLNPELESMPNEEEAAKMTQERRGLTRPQLALLSSYARTLIKNSLLGNDKFFSTTGVDQYLVRYFPSAMHESRFADAIAGHPLRKEIIATCVANDIVNRMGCTFLNHVCEQTGLEPFLVAKIFIFIDNLYDLSSLWKSVDRLDYKIPFKYSFLIFREIQRFVGRITFWFAGNLAFLDKAADTLEYDVSYIESNISSLIDDKTVDHYNSSMNKFLKLNIDDEVSTRVAAMGYTYIALEIIKISRNTDISLYNVGRIYFALKSLLRFDYIRDLAMKLTFPISYWRHVTIRGLLDDLDKHYSLLTINVIKSTIRGGLEGTFENFLRVWHEKSGGSVERYNSLVDSMVTSGLDMSKFVVIVKRFSGFNSLFEV